MDYKKYVKERDKAFTEAVENDNFKPCIKFCKKYGLSIPKDEKVMKAGIYKAVQECTNISEATKGKAMVKCLALGFKPFI